ncbi:MAG: carboxylating nicotinate-nucleotide diphosphorylase [Candidatus Hydrogenedens sp.]|jgi:nicotinate-nucleotide pyrophosphorylase (carboxylating)|nr:carboxylating nicotinate-nucleotide diphosphorylase [Candidatus Hydrogenedens sp.]
MDKTIRTIIAGALQEDVGLEDITTSLTVDPDIRCQVRLISKDEGILSGMKAFRCAFDLLDADIQDWRAESDGCAFSRGHILASFTGTARAVLTAERTALNFLQRLSGVATLTRQFVQAVDGLPCRICGTRKTGPYIRHLEKQAIVHGGGATHRHSLFDGILIKDNHITMAGGVVPALKRAREGAHHLLRVAIEAATLAEFDEALAAGADVILLDNMDLETLAEAVRRARASSVILEASGNMTLDRVRAVAETGVHYISAGALTHSAAALDLSLLVERF